MTTTSRPVDGMKKGLRDALVDQLRACQTQEEILNFEKWFNAEMESGPLYQVICDLLRNRSISRVLAAKWLSALLEDKESKIKNINS